jgi:hypothetical protein
MIALHCMYMKYFALQSIISPGKPPLQELKQKHDVLTSYWVSVRFFFVQPGDSCNGHTPFLMHAG